MAPDTSSLTLEAQINGAEEMHPVDQGAIQPPRSATVPFGRQRLT